MQNMISRPAISVPTVEKKRENAVMRFIAIRQDATKTMIFFMATKTTWMSVVILMTLVFLVKDRAIPVWSVTRSISPVRYPQITRKRMRHHR